MIVDSPADDGDLLFIAKLESLEALEYLSMYMESIEAETLESPLKAARRVRTFHIFIEDSYDDLFKLLASDVNLVPNLEPGESEVVPDAGNRMDTPLFDKLLASRAPHARPPGNCLSKILLRGKEIADIADHQPFIQSTHRYSLQGLLYKRRVGPRWIRVLKDGKRWRQPRSPCTITIRQLFQLFRI